MQCINNQVFLLVGGAGFIGSHLADNLLAQGADHVVIIDNFFLGRKENLDFAIKSFPDRVTIIEADACEYQTLFHSIKSTKPDVVVNLATKALLHSFEDPADAYKVNTDIVLNLLELIRKNYYSKLLHISTSEVFGSAEYIPMDEKHPRKPETTYAAGKCAADMAVESYINMFGIDAIILRPFNNFGPRQNTEALAAIIPKTVKRIIAGLSPIVEGDGLQTRDFIYVEDTVKIISHFIFKRDLNLREFNIGSGIETRIIDLIENICRLMDYKGSILYQPARIADVKRHCCDIRRAEFFLGKLNVSSMKTSLDKTISWYLENLKRLNK